MSTTCPMPTLSVPAHMAGALRTPLRRGCRGSVVLGQLGLRACLTHSLTRFYLFPWQILLPVR